MAPAVLLGVEAVIAIMTIVQKMSDQKNVLAHDEVVLALAKINAFLDIIDLEVTKRRSKNVGTIN